ncbi:Uncharacterised protein [Mycobacteroides abscessus subsp. abscessus]|nr:Uncharacterised protein [Mycobacteroides abscessus subsp. abscessus]
MVVFVGEVPGQRPLGAEHTDSSVASQEDRLVVQVAAQRVEGPRVGDHLDRVDTDLQPEVLVAAEDDVVIRGVFVLGVVVFGRIVGLVLVFVRTLVVRVRILVKKVQLVVVLEVVVLIDGILGGSKQLGVRGSGEFLVDIGCCGDLVDRVDHGVP